MARINWPLGAARLFVLTDLTYTPDAKTGTWKTQLVLEEWTAGPETYTGGPIAPGGVPPTAQADFAWSNPGDQVAFFNPNLSIFSGHVQTLEWWWGDGATLSDPPDFVRSGEYPLNGLPNEAYFYAIAGNFTASLRITADGVVSPVISHSVVIA